MTAHPLPSAFRICSESEAFRDLRGAFIDEFARLEIAVGGCLKRLGEDVDGRKTCFSQQLDKLSGAKPSPRLSKERAVILRALCEDCEPINRLRASIVHSVMEEGSRDGEPVALFRNVADSVRGDLIYQVLTAAEFRDAIEALRAITGRFDESLNQASSQPRPKRAEAAGP